MGPFGDKHVHAKFISFIAGSLFDRAPNRQERDELQNVIYGAHTHHVPSGYGKKPMGLKDMITPEHQWVIDAIRDSQETWKLANKKLPFDFLDPKRGEMFQDLGEALGEVRRSRMRPGGESGKE